MILGKNEEYRFRVAAPLRTALVRAFRKRKYKGRVVVVGLTSPYEYPSKVLRVIDGDEAPRKPPYIRRFGLLSRIALDYNGWSAPSSEQSVGLIEIEGAAKATIGPIRGWTISPWVLDAVTRLIQEIRPSCEVRQLREPND